MTTIVRAAVNDSNLLVQIGTKSFIESHGMSAPKKDIDYFLALKFSEANFLKELRDTKNHFYIINHNQTPVGYSKIIFDFPHPLIPFENVTKLEQIYLLQEYHHLKLGLELFNFNLQESLKHHQAGMWLFVWTENTKALNFYNKVGFKIIGDGYYKISENHSNPNHQMLLVY